MELIIEKWMDSIIFPMKFNQNTDEAYIKAKNNNYNILWYNTTGIKHIKQHKLKIGLNYLFAHAFKLHSQTLKVMWIFSL